LGEDGEVKNRPIITRLLLYSEDAMQTHSRRAVLAGFAALTLSPGPGTAQDQALKIVFPFSAGASADAVARLIAEHLQKSLGRPVIVENKVGAGGRIGAQAVKDALPNGAMLLFASGAQFTLQPHVFPSLGYDPFVDFIPISQVVKFDLALAVSSQLPVRSIKELVAWFKTNPVHAVYGSPGAGTGAHFAAMEFGRIFGLDLRHVAYRGTPAALPDLLTGRVPMYIASSAELLEQHKSGGISILAIAEATRSPILPDIPTLKESGVDVDAPGWFAFYAPAHTPAEVIESLAKAIVAATRAPETHAKILALGFQPTGTTPEELKQLQRAQFERWGPMVKASGFKAEQ
jgi:tripartite-type tricarboxylate transporter receptor subunit TctC